MASIPAFQTMSPTGGAGRAKIGLITCPAWNPCGPALGFGLLNGYLKHHGHDSFVMDLASEWRAVAGGEFRRAMDDIDVRLLESRDFAARLFSEHERFVQEKVDQLLGSGADVFGFSLYFTTRESSLELARRIKRRDPSRLIVCGGPECIRQKELLLHIGAEEGIIDAIVPGVGETALGKLLDSRRDGRFDVCPGARVRVGTKFLDGGAAEPLGNLDEIPFPDFGSINMALYRQPVTLPTYFSRGCPNQCAFCETKAYWGDRWQNRSGARVAQEIEALCLRYPDSKSFEFCDTLLNANIRELESFCDRLLEARLLGMPLISWWGSAVIRPDMTSALFRKMKAAGCDALVVGVESGSQRVLDSMRKRQDIPSVKRFLKDAKAAGVRCRVNLMVGFPTETEEDFRQTLDFVVRNADAIDSIYPSPVLVREDTYLHQHAFDEYGIAERAFHTEYWSSQDGQNTYPERMRRFRLLCETARQAGITAGGSWRDILGDKDRRLQGYAEFMASCGRSGDARGMEFEAAESQRLMIRD